MPKPLLYARTALLVLAGLAPDRTTIVRAQEIGSVPCAACLVFVLSPGESLLLPDVLNGLEVLIRASPDAPAGAYLPQQVRSAVLAVRAAGGRPGLLVEHGAGPLEAAVAREAFRIVVRVAGGVPAAGPELLFALRQQLADLRGATPDAALGLAGPAAVLDALEPEIAPYVDFLVRPPASPVPVPAVAAGAVVIGAIEPPGAAGGPERWVLDPPADALAAWQLLADVARAAPFLREGLIAGGTVEVRCGTVPVPTYLDPATLDTIAVARGCGPAALRIAPDVRDAGRATLSDGAILLRLPAAEGAFADDVRVVGARTLTVREIIARHQAAAAGQRRQVRQLISTGSMTLTFEAPGFPAPLAITSETVIYTAPDRAEIEQRDIRINGVSFQAGGIPRLPLLEPERVASPPLAITLTERYTYALAGQDRVGDVLCYVVAFQPLDRREPLFAGRAWIAADTFAMVRVSAVQTGLRGPIVSSDQTDEFRPVSGIWLLARSDVRQIYEGAGHRTPIHRVLAVDRHEVNPPDFAARRQAAYASPSIMLRDTPEGFRYLERQPAAEGDPVPALRLAGPATRVRTFAAGVIVDPNITRPLPFAGLSYVDFNLFGTGAQLNGFFGGTYGQLAVSVPSLAGTRWQLAGRGFAIASSYNDRAFAAGREIYDRNITQRPAHASAWLVRPLTPRISARIGYDFDYIGFGRADTTADAFVVPASQLSHGLRLGAEGQWSGWTAAVWWLGARRAAWRAWGLPDPSGPGVAYDPRHRDYQRYGAGLGRSWVASPRLVGRLDAVWMAGRDLDRFSRYTFGSFDNRLRGYPAALVRYDRGAVFRAAAAWAAGRLLRVDGFLDSALVRDAGYIDRLRSFTGAGAAVEVPVPFGTLLAVEWGYGFQGVNTDGGRGTHVVRISGYKMF